MDVACALDWRGFRAQSSPGPITHLILPIESIFLGLSNFVRIETDAICDRFKFTLLTEIRFSFLSPFENGLLEVKSFGTIGFRLDFPTCFETSPIFETTHLHFGASVSKSTGTVICPNQHDQMMINVIKMWTELWLSSSKSEIFVSPRLIITRLSGIVEPPVGIKLSGVGLPHLDSKPSTRHDVILFS